MSAVTVTWQGNVRPMDGQCRGGSRPDKPCGNPVAGVMHMTGGTLEACELHMHKPMSTHRREADQ